MGLQVFASRHAPGDHGFGLHPILFDQQGKIEVTDKAGHQAGREKAVGNAVVIDKIPAQAEKGKGKEIPEGLPEYKPSQDQEEEVPSRGPVEEYLAWMVLGRESVRFG
jgi:hypothetical protein